MLPHEPRILPPDACPHCGSVADTARDEWGYTYCQSCDRARDSVLDMVARERKAHGGGPRAAR